MPDICDLILDEHETFRRRFAELDEHREEPETLKRLWDPLAELLERHAAAEETIFYPELLARGQRAEDETDDAIDDHNDIRDAVRDAASTEPGSDAWWEAVSKAREENSDHMGEEERGALADFRAHAPEDVREEIGNRWVDYNQKHAGGRGVDSSDKDPEEYIEEHKP